MNKSIKLSLFACLFGITSLYSQITESKEEKAQKVSELKSVFKYDPLRLLVGEVAFSYERKTGVNSSFEFELGPTISEVKPFNSNHYGFGSSNVKSGIGGFASIGYRYYPVKGTFSGIYISPKIKYKMMNSIYQDASGTIGDFLSTRNQGSFMFNFGVQKWASSKLSFDFYTGVGIGFNNQVYPYQSTIYNYQTNTNSYSWSAKTENYTSLFFNLGVKIGIGYGTN